MRVVGLVDKLPVSKEVLWDCEWSLERDRRKLP